MDKRLGLPFGVTNMKLLSEKTGIGAWKISKAFKKEKRVYYEDSDFIILVINVDEIETGNQRFLKRDHMSG